MNMNKMLKQAQKMQKEMLKAQEELAAEEVQTSAGGGAVKLTLSGEYQVKSIEIDSDLAKEDPEMLGDLLTVAFNNAVNEVKAKADSRMGSLTGGMPGLPGLM